MLLFSKIISKFILPPGIFFSVMVSILIFSHKKNSRKINLFLLINIVLIYFISTAPLSDFLMKSLENKYQPADYTMKMHGDYIVILGGGIILSSPDEGGKGSLSPDSLKRLVMGVHLARNNDIPLIVSGGRVLRGPENEAESSVAKRTLIQLGIDKKRIFEEDESRNTWESPVYLNRKYQMKKVILVTSAYHMPRSVFCFTSNNIEVIPVPSDYKACRGQYSILSFIPNMDDFKNFYTAFREYIGFLYYIFHYG